MKRAAGARKKRSEERGSAVPVCTLDDLPMLPEFHLLLTPEPDAVGKQMKSKEQQHIESLLAEYQQQEGLEQVPCLLVCCQLIRHCSHMGTKPQHITTLVHA